MVALIVLGSIVLLGVFLYLNYYIAKQFEEVAISKGHTERRYFHLCFWLGLVGYLLVIALPNNRAMNLSQNSIPAKIDEKLPEL